MWYVSGPVPRQNVIYIIYVFYIIHTDINYTQSTQIHTHSKYSVVHKYTNTSLI